MKPTSLSLTTFSLAVLACRPTPTPDVGQVGEVAPDPTTPGAQEVEVLSEAFVFSIDGMKKINGAL